MLHELCVLKSSVQERTSSTGRGADPKEVVAMPPQVCRYWQQGNCRFGANCRNAHELPGASSASGASGGGGSDLPGPNEFSAMAKTMRDDLTDEKERPSWYVSVYTPYKQCPNIIEDTDLSREELRWQAYQAKAGNTFPQYVQQEAGYVSKMDEVIRRTASDTLAAYRNFYNTRRPINLDPPAPSSAFGGGGGGGFAAFATSTPSAFGQPAAPASAFGQPAPTSAFGQPAGQTSAFGGTTSAFGQPSAPTSAFGQSTQSAFGQSTQSFGQPTQSAFGQSQPAGQPAKGFAAFASSTPSAFGQPAAPTSAFGQATSGAFGGAFAQANQGAFGQAAAASNAFGGKVSAFGGGPASTPANAPAGGGGGGFAAFATPGPSAFGGGATGGGSNVFGQQPAQQSAFAAQPAANPAPVSAFGQAPQATSAFGAPPAASNPFGAPQQPAAATQAPPPAAIRFPLPATGLKLDIWASEAPKEEDLPPDVLAAFKAPDFEWGAIPLQVPPVSLR